MRKFSKLINLYVIILVFVFSTYSLAFAENKIRWFAELCRDKKSLIEVTIDCSSIPTNAIVVEAILEVAFFDQNKKQIGKELFSFLDEKKLQILSPPNNYLRYFEHKYPYAHSARGLFLHASARVRGTMFQAPGFSVPVRYKPEFKKFSTVANIKAIDSKNIVKHPKKQILISSFAKEKRVDNGKSALIEVQVKGTNGIPIVAAIVEVSAGGGRFLRTGGYSSLGYTSKDGIFHANWHCYSCAPGYGFEIRVKKSGYYESEGSCQIRF